MVLLYLQFGHTQLYFRGLGMNVFNFKSKRVFRTFCKKSSQLKAIIFQKCFVVNA